MEIEKVIGQLLHEQRTMRHYTQKLVAKTLGLKPSTYANYETGNRLFPAKYVTTLATKLKFDVSKIIELHPRINEDYPIPDNDDDLIIIESKSIVVGTPVDTGNLTNPVITYMATEGYNITLHESSEDYMQIKTDEYEMSLSQEEVEELKKNVTSYIEFELYKKRTQ